MRAGRLKLELALRGASLDASAHPLLAAPDGSPSALDLLLPGGTCVTVPVRMPQASPYRLLGEGRRLLLVQDANGSGAPAPPLEVRAVPVPRFMQRRTSRGIPMARIATLRGAHLVVNPASACGFSLRGAPCRFCVEGARVATDRDAVPVSDVLEVVRAAFDDGIRAAVYFNSGVFDADDGGIAFLAPYVEAVRRHFDTLVATQVHPPRSNAWIDRTYAMGVDAVSYNLEVFDADLLKRHCVGRARYIGRERYLDALGHAARIFPSGTVWSELVVGLEPATSTRAGIEALATLGVVPVVALCRSAPAVPDPADIAPLLAHLFRAVKRHRITMSWVRDLTLAVTPIEARHFAGARGGLASTVQHLSRSRLGALAARSLARARRRLRVRTIDGSDTEAES
jgi:hypothetical protein